VASWNAKAEREVSEDRKQPEDLHRLLLDIVHVTSLAPDFRHALRTFVEQAAGLIAGDGVAVLWLQGDDLEVLASSGSTAPLQGLTLPASQMGSAQAVLDSLRPFAVADTAQEPRWQRVPGEERARAWLGAPLLCDERPLGVIEWTCEQPQDWSESQVVAAAELGQHAAPVLHQAQLLHDMRQHLFKVIEPRAIKTPQMLDLSGELQPLVREALEFTAARDAFVFLTGEGSRWLRCVASAGERRDLLRNKVLRGDGTLGGWRLPQFRSRDWLGGSVSDRETMAALGIERVLILPLRVGHEPVGVLGVAEPRSSREFGQDAMRLMTHLASQVSLAVERCRQAQSQHERTDYEVVIQAAPLGIGVLTMSGEIETCNPALTGLLSRSERSVVGRKVTDFVVASDSPRLTQALQEVAVSGQRRQVDVGVQPAPGEQRQVRISLAASPMLNDVSGAVVALVEDVTSLKILEIERVEHLQELREKHDQLQELDRLKSRFVSNVSHELRTPLAVIKLYATLARKGRPEKQEYYLQTIEQETHRLETMVENILDLTRMDRQALQVNPEWLAVDEIIEQVLEVYQETAKKQCIELRNHVTGPLPRLWADKNHVIQMLTNLMDNALKYTPRDGRVWIGAREYSDNSQKRFEIVVGDTGVGIAPDELEKIFERFYRGSNNTPGSTGTGLGLAIVQELMAQHGGRVTLKSTAGKGSVFGLHFPLPDQHDQARDAEQAQGKQGGREGNAQAIDS
jgi:PAS domain S-box-containing protein